VLDPLTLTITISLACLLVWQMVMKVRVIRHFRQPLPTLIEDRDCPRAMVVLCLRGGDPYLRQTLKLLIDQDYPRYRVRIVVDSAGDEAHQILRQVLGDAPPAHVQIDNLTERHSTCTLKICGLLQATRDLPDDVGVVAILDGDAIPHASWLRELATPIVRGEAGVSTGIRWYAPRHSTLGGLCRFWWNASAMAIVMQQQISWGGTMAVRGDLLRRGELRSRLQRAFGEDSVISGYAIDVGERIAFPPTLVIVNREETTVRDFYRFDVRQLVSGRTSHGAWPTLALHSLCSSLALMYPLWRLCGLPMGNLADIAFAVYCLTLWAGELAQAQAIRALLATRNETITGWSEFGRWVDSAAALMVLPGLHLLAVLYAMTLRRVCWRGVWYRIRGPLSVSIERDDWAADSNCRPTALESAPLEPDNKATT
jgi:hypothetical protein